MFDLRKFLFENQLTTNSQTINEVWKYIYQSGIQHHEIVMAQCVLESGWNLDSYNAKHRHNLLGIQSHAKFKHWHDCIDYYSRWQRKYYKGGDYYDFLNCIYKGKKGDCKRYAQDPAYTDKLDIIIWQLWSC